MKKIKIEVASTLFFLLVICTYPSSKFFCQSDSSKQNYLGLTYSFDQIRQANQNLKTRKMPGFTAGITFKHSFTNKFEINSSLVFSSRNFETYDITLGSSINPTSGFDTTYSLNKNYQSLEIPIYFQYNLVLKGNLKVYPFVGTTLNFYLNSSHVWKTFDVNGDMIYSTNTRYKGAGGTYFELGKLIGLGVSYNFNPKWHLALNFIARMYEYNKNGGTYTTSNGVNLQLFYKFDKN